MMIQTHTTQAQAFLSSVSDASPYVLGPLDRDRLTRLIVSLSNGEKIVLILPDASLMPSTLVSDPHFFDGVLAGWEMPDLSEILDVPSIPVLMNRVCRSFTEDLEWGGVYSSAVGYLLGALSNLAQEDECAALVGIAHLCYLMRLVPWLPVAGSLHLSRLLVDARYLSDEAVCSFRAHVQLLRANGLTFEEAQRQALGIEQPENVEEVA